MSGWNFVIDFLTSGEFGALNFEHSLKLDNNTILVIQIIFKITFLLFCELINKFYY